MNPKIILKEIEFGSPEQIESVNLRYKILREPLGLDFTKEDLAREYEDFHLAAYIENQIIAILLLTPTEHKSTIKMRQVAVAEYWQGKGIGKLMVRFSEDNSKLKGFKKIELHARKTAVPFYLSLGYSVSGKMFYEVGIPHKKMFKNL